MRKANVQGIIARYNEIVEFVDPLLHLARNGELQSDAAAMLREFIPTITAEKDVAIEFGSEREANILLGLEALARGSVAELEMYVLLKQDSPDKAWDRLIDAEMALAAAMRADRSFEYLDKKGHVLRALEYYFFPPQQFLSAGFIVGRQECSICRDEYGKCSHLAGRAYRGKFCNIILKDVTADHVALVDDPANRHCRVISFSVPGGTRNKMTWVITPDDPDKPRPNIPDGTMVMDSTIASIHDFGGEWPDDPPANN